MQTPQPSSRPYIRVLAALTALFVMTVWGTDAAGQASSTNGLMLTAGVNAAGWTVTDLAVDSERGPGFFAAAGYGLNDIATIFAALAVNGISQDGGDEYRLGHLDLGARFALLSTSSAFRPYIELAIGLRSAAWEDPEMGKVEALGPGATFGAGLMYYVAPPLAIDAGFKMTVGDLTDVTVENRNFEVEYHGRSARVGIGLTWYPMK